MWGITSPVARGLWISWGINLQMALAFRAPPKGCIHHTDSTCVRANLRQGWMPPHPTLYLRRAVFDRWGLYDTSFRIAAGYDAMLRYLVKRQIRLAYVPCVFVRMGIGGESSA